ncbi:MAG: DUF2662 domain-containing protein [Deltaproteobacteria bacterium]|nr:DUF2662 domain-containing protein [Deltaproteobacteria bacterium]
MGIITKIEDRLGNIVENPFRDEKGLDLIGVEISLKRLMELKRRNILGKIIVPNDLLIIINKETYEEYELFLDKFKTTLIKNLNGWMKEKDYEMSDKMALSFKGDLLENKSFEVFVSFKKANGGNGDRAQIDSNAYGQEDAGKGDKDFVGELANPKTGEMFGINKGRTIIGREEDCTIKVSDPTVSRKHAFLSYQDGKVILEDLGSKCGTWVNHQKINKQILRHSDRIRIGGTELTFQDRGGEKNLIHDGTERKEISQPEDKLEKKMDSSDPNLLGLSYFF